MNRLALVLCVALFPLAQASADDSVDNIVLAVHGGAGVLSKELLSPEKEQEYRDMLLHALKAGHAVLKKENGKSVDAVVATIKVLEDSPLFNAGRGGALTRDGKVELDASLMDGESRKAGAVGGVTTIKNPIEGARLVMEKTRHVMMVGAGAELLAKQNGAEIVPNSYFETELRRAMLKEALQEEEQRKKKQGQNPPANNGASAPARLSPEQRFGTVGCVALDAKGNLAAGTSTGGMTMKLSGRLGDSPIIGAATYANNESCAVSATGDGEYFIRAVAAHDIAALVEYGNLSVAQAGRRVIAKIHKAGGEGGVIVLDPLGNLAFSYSSEGMYRGYLTKSGEYKVLIYRD